MTAAGGGGYDHAVRASLRLAALVLAALVLAVVACAPAGVTDPTSIASPESTAQPPDMPPETPAPVSIVPQELLDQVLDQAASQAGVSLDELTVERAQQVTWSDGSLGCPAPGEMYTQALVDGYWVVVSAAGQTHDFHLAANGTIKLCPPGRGRPPAG